jgi:Fe2+ transport system protein B
MKPIFSDTESILRERLSIISESIEQGAASLRKQDIQATKEITTQILKNKEQLKQQQSEATKEALELITKQAEQMEQSFMSAFKEQSAFLTAVQADHKNQIESLRQSFQESNLLQAEIAQQVTLKKALTTSVLPLIFLVFILVTCSIGAGFYLKSQKDQLYQLHSQVEELRQKGGSLKLSNCDNRLCVQIDPKAPTYDGNYRIVAEK